MSITVETKTNFQQALDKKLLAGLTSAPMEANASQVQYEGGKEFKIPKLDVDGLSTYDRGSGYTAGDYTFEYETKTFDMDRGKKFPIDAMDVDETGFVLAAGTISDRFLAEQVIPEIDAYRYSKLFAIAEKAGVAKHYAPNKDTIFSEFKGHLTEVNNITGGAPLIAFVNALVLGTLEGSKEFTRMVTETEVQSGERKTKIRSIDGVQIVAVPSARMRTEYVFENGFTPATGAGEINWIITPVSAPLAIVKHAVPKVVTPEQNQNADAYIFGYRVYHTLEVADNKQGLLRVSYEGQDAPELKGAFASGTAAGTKFTASEALGTGNKLGYFLGDERAVKLGDLVVIGTTAVEGFTKEYTSGADIADAVKDDYLTVAKYDKDGRVLEVASMKLTATEIFSA